MLSWQPCRANMLVCQLDIHLLPHSSRYALNLLLLRLLTSCLKNSVFKSTSYLSEIHVLQEAIPAALLFKKDALTRV